MRYEVLKQDDSFSIWDYYENRYMAFFIVARMQTVKWDEENKKWLE